MPIVNHEGNKVVVIAGEGDIMWSSGTGKKDTESEYIVIWTDGVKRPIGKTYPEMKGKEIDNWSVKIVLPTKEAWMSFMSILESYGIEKGFKVNKDGR